MHFLPDKLVGYSQSPMAASSALRSTLSKKEEIKFGKYSFGHGWGYILKH